MIFLKTRCVCVCISWKINRVKWGSDNKSRDSVCVYVVVILCDSILVETCKYLKCATCSAAAHMSKVEKNGAIFFHCYAYGSYDGAPAITNPIFHIFGKGEKISIDSRVYCPYFSPLTMGLFCFSRNISVMDEAFLFHALYGTNLYSSIPSNNIRAHRLLLK